MRDYLKESEAVEDGLYKTTDYDMATFLVKEGLELAGIERNEEDSERCNFVLKVPESINFVVLLKKWAGPESESDKRLLYCNRKLKTALAQFFKNEDEHKVPRHSKE